MPEEELERQLQQSWKANAAAWTDAVRRGAIASRKAGTDSAIRDAIRQWPPCRVLDLGCGEGWLARSLHAHGYEVVGVDGSSALVAEAQAAGGGRFLVLSYDQLVSNPASLPGPFEVIAANFGVYIVDKLSRHALTLGACSSDEVRTQKALALLEFTEAEQNMARLERQKEELVKDIRNFASMLDKAPGAILPTKENYPHLRLDAVYELLSKLDEARQILADATAKKNHFGL